VERKVNGLRDRLYAATLAPVDVAILRSAASAYGSAPDHRHRNDATAVAKYLLERHMLPLMIPEEHLQAAPEQTLKDVRVLVCPWTIHLPPDVQKAILRWVRADGTLVASGPLGLLDEYGSPAGLVLRESIGDLPWRYDANAEQWRANGGEDGETQVAQCGRGKIHLRARAFSENGWDELSAALAEAVPTPFIQTTLPHLEAVPWRGPGNTWLLFLVNLDARRPLRGSLTVRGRYAAAIDLTCEARPPVPVTPGANGSRIPVLLPPGGAVLLELSPR
jgi:hypothetical protein